jgi:hypothetical protein
MNKWKEVFAGIWEDIKRVAKAILKPWEPWA